jgi:hypothetical protein
MNGAAAKMANYRLFGLKVRSEIPLPELPEDQSEDRPQVLIRRGAVEADGAKAGLNQDGDALLLTIPDVGRYRIAGGSDITVDAAANIPASNIRLFLLGSAFGALLHQRRMLPLHANAIEVNGQAVAFMGESGTGKSTLAAWFHDRGYRILADDVCVVGLNEAGQPVAAPGLPRLRLWSDALEFTGRDASNFSRSYTGAAEQLDKFDVPIDASSVRASPAELAGVYLLERGNRFSITPATGLGAAELLFANTYRGSYLPLVNGQQDHWQSAIKLVRSVPVFRAARKWDLAKLNEQCALLLQHVESVTHGGPDER